MPWYRQAVTMTIDELARRTGMTTRNIRAYQTKGLLPPPEIRGRTGYYGPEHLERLELVRTLQAQGLNLGAIEWALTGDSVRALRAAVMDTFAPDEPEVEEREALEGRLGPLEAATIERAEAMGIVELADDDRVRVLQPRIVARAADLVGMGVPVTAQLDVLEVLQDHAGAIAASFMALVREYMGPALGEHAADLDSLREASRRLHGVAADVLLAAFDNAMRAEIDALLSPAAREQSLS